METLSTAAEAGWDNPEPAGQKDLADIWRWNATVPKRIDACVHDLIADAVRLHADRPAICAWDGDLTYRELDALSDALANELVSSLDGGVGPGTIVPLCFEKSMWTPVAMLGVMKAGAASAAMDTTYPEDRLRGIVQQVLGHSKHRRVILCSVANEDLASRLVQHEDSASIFIPEMLLRDLHHGTTASGDRHTKRPPASRSVTPDDMLYVVFTSGSTGRPKGVVITHANFSSAIAHHRVPLCFDSSCRVFDFASYAFDVAWSDLLHTLAAGGCVCIPNEDQRRTDPHAAIRGLRANYLDLTPTVARQLVPDEVPDVHTIVFGGERVMASDLVNWATAAAREGREVKLRNPYGPAECTVTSTVLIVPPEGQRSAGESDSAEPGIGRGCGLVTWIVQTDTLQLSAVGDAGELWLEGPLVGSGYLGEMGKTSAAFVEDTAWLVRGGGGVPGRRGRLYRTGDLVRYNRDGTLQFLGRMDDQVKIRGQRVELGDVEHHLGQCLAGVSGVVSVVADVVQPAGGTSAPLLVAFVGVSDLADHARQSALSSILGPVQDSMAERLPGHMVPTAYIPVGEMPLTGTGKVDRRLLRHRIAEMTLQELADINAARRHNPRREPSTDTERILVQLWSQVLSMDANNISADDHFSRLGGDSISAMRLVAAARQRGQKLHVADVLHRPRLCDMAAKLVSTSQQTVNHDVAVAPFSLVSGVHVRRNIQNQIRKNYGPDATVQDVLPITDFQAYCLQYAMVTPLGRTQQFFVDMPRPMALQRLVDACNRLWEYLDTLRTIFVHGDAADQHHHRLLQVTPLNVPLDISIHMVESPREASLSWFAADKSVLKLGKCDFRMAIFQDPAGHSRLAMRLCHAQYDGFVHTQMADCLTVFLNQQDQDTAPPLLFPFSVHMQSVADERQRSIPFWRGLLQDATFARLDFDKIKPAGDESDSLLQAHTVWVDASQNEFTAATNFFAMAVLAISQLTGSQDTTIGVVVSGRSTSPHQWNIAGPCVNFVPLRVILEGDIEVEIDTVTRHIHNQRLGALAFEGSQMSDLAETVAPWAKTDQFGFILQFQNIEEDPTLRVDGEDVQIQVVKRPMVYVDPTIYILAKPQGDRWAVSLITSPRFYLSSTVDRVAEVFTGISKRQPRCLPKKE